MRNPGAERMLVQGAVALKGNPETRSLKQGSQRANPPTCGHISQGPNTPDRGYARKAPAVAKLNAFGPLCGELWHKSREPWFSSRNH